MEASGDIVPGDVSVLDSNGPRLIDSTNGTCDSKIADLNTFSRTSSNSKELQSELIIKASEAAANSIQERQTTGTAAMNDEFANQGKSTSEDVNNLIVSENVKNVCKKREKASYPEKIDESRGIQPDLRNDTSDILVSNDELPSTEPTATNGTKLEMCTSESITLHDNVRNTTACGKSSMEQFIHQEKINDLKGRNGNFNDEITCANTNNNDIEPMIINDQSESNDTSMEERVNENDMTNPNGNSKNILTCNRDPEQSINQENMNVIKEMNGNSDNSNENIEPMVTDDPPEKEKVINEAHSDGENNATMSNGIEGNRNASVVEAMNKDLTWNTDKVYQKDLRSLKLLCDYGSDSNDEEEVNDEKNIKEVVDSSNKNVSNVPVVNPCPAVHQDYREPEVVSVSDSDDESDSSDDETSSTSTATSSSSSDETEESEDECVVVEEKITKVVPKTKGELGLEDLPPIEDLHITVPESECVEIGKVLSIVDSLVVVQSMQGCPALDLDSVLFRDHGQNALGEVFDVFGKVGEACYCVRFNSKDHAIEKGIEVGMPVYYAPRTEYSRYVFLADLTKMKGSDASWAHNNEPPLRFLDYSDDEQERRAKKGNKLVVRNVEREESQPQAKRFNRRGPNRGGEHGASTSPRSERPWSTPFNRYHMEVPASQPSPADSPCSSPHPKPLIRPSSFRNSGPPPPHSHDNDESFRFSPRPPRSGFQPVMQQQQPPSFGGAGPPEFHFHENTAMGGPAPSPRCGQQPSFMPLTQQSHFHNAAAGAPPVWGGPMSSQMFPPQFQREDYRFGVPPVQSPFAHTQMRPNSFTTKGGDYRQPPPTPPPLPPAPPPFVPSSIMRPTSIPNPGLFAVEPSNGFKVEPPASFIPNQPPLMRQEFHSSFGGGSQGPFGSQQPVFMNPNIPPPPSSHPPSHPPPPPPPGW